LGIVVTQLGYILCYAKKTSGSFEIAGTLGLKTRLTVKEYLTWIPLLIVITAGLFVITQPIGIFMQRQFFGWIPDWYVFETDISSYSAPAVAITFILLLVGTSTVVPIVEEIFFRGFLLPRMTGLGKWAVAVNVIIFAIYHFWSPWQIVVRIIALLPFYYIVKKKDSLMLAICVHCLINTISDVLIPAFAYYLL